MQFYSNPEREVDPYALPDCEVFHLPDPFRDGEQLYGVGWYYWYCFPGCLPDSDPVGPFDTESEAISAAQSEAA
jgi:hypothetical protein